MNDHFYREDLVGEPHSFSKANHNEAERDLIQRKLSSLIRTIRSPNCEIEDVGRLIKNIPGLANAIIRRANSPEFSLKHHVERIEHAIMVLGLRRTLETVKRRRDPAHQTEPPKMPTITQFADMPQRHTA